MSGRHSILPPSSAYIWGKPDGCPGWVSMMRQVPVDDTPRPEALEGTAAHNLGARMVDEVARTARPTPEGSIVGTFDEETGLAYTPEMYECACIYAENCLSIMRRTHVHGGPYLGIERTMSAPSVHSTNFGTVDFFIFGRVRPETTIDIVDYKHGHVWVDAYENWQLINYLAAVLDTFHVDGALDQTITVRLHIVQPRAYRHGGPVDTWELRASDARAYINQLRTGAEIALWPDSVCRSGPHCRYCDARGHCQAALTAGLAMWESVADTRPQTLTPATLGPMADLLERAGEQIKALETSIRAQIESHIRAGQPVSGWEMARSLGRRNWTIPTAEVIAIGAGCGVDLSKPATLTPTQAAKAGLDPAIIESFSARSETVKLERVSLHELRRIFK